MRDHDKVFNEMSQDIRKKFICGEVMIVTQNVSKRGKTEIVDAGRPDFKALTTLSPIIRPTYEFNRPTAKNR